jgi:hypothetical protein
MSPRKQLALNAARQPALSTLGYPLAYQRSIFDTINGIEYTAYLKDIHGTQIETNGIVREDGNEVSKTISARFRMYVYQINVLNSITLAEQYKPSNYIRNLPIKKLSKKSIAMKSCTYVFNDYIYIYI